LTFSFTKKEIFCETVSPQVFKRDWCQKFGRCCGFWTKNGDKNLLCKTVSPKVIKTGIVLLDSAAETVI
jgi:hypothetical protein